ncbi:LysE family translocator [Saccharopolyspora hirsuta]|uniref:LysE family translocator n=1 Tax=Saccharopolyspora hirsuta TaxID=1837 RepID=A0A5M7CBL6_SACHI|nr:LysE family transporter [Saccharopolyspora hirsuta]KAA5837084.1 LysE family translocator [Saccharopolyspora hirsuta]
MDQFLAVALAHFLALLIPGVDFFLIVRTAAAHGWRSASGVCTGIASANGVFIVAALTGLTLVGDDRILAWIELAGGAFLISMGLAFWRARISLTVDAEGVVGRAVWIRNVGLGLASGLLNPKNLLFYVSLAATLSSATTGQLTLYGAWMFSIVLAWDLFVAAVMGAKRSRTILARALPWITKAAAIVVTLFGIGAVLAAVRTLVV